MTNVKKYDQIDQVKSNKYIYKSLKRVVFRINRTKGENYVEFCLALFGVFDLVTKTFFSFVTAKLSKRNEKEKEERLVKKELKKK